MWRNPCFPTSQLAYLAKNSFNSYGNPVAGHGFVGCRIDKRLWKIGWIPRLSTFCCGLVEEIFPLKSRKNLPQRQIRWPWVAKSGNLTIFWGTFGGQQKNSPQNVHIKSRNCEQERGVLKMKKYLSPLENPNFHSFHVPYCDCC